MNRKTILFLSAILLASVVLFVAIGVLVSEHDLPVATTNNQSTLPREFAYTSVTVYVGQPVVINPTGDAFLSYTVDTPLPDGLTVGSTNGIISGTCTTPSEAAVYTIIGATSGGYEPELVFLARTTNGNTTDAPFEIFKCIDEKYPLLDTEALPGRTKSFRTSVPRVQIRFNEFPDNYHLCIETWGKKNAGANNQNVLRIGLGSIHTIDIGNTTFITSVASDVDTTFLMEHTGAVANGLFLHANGFVDVNNDNNGIVINNDWYHWGIKYTFLPDHMVELSVYRNGALIGTVTGQSSEARKSTFFIHYLTCLNIDNVVMDETYIYAGKDVSSFWTTPPGRTVYAQETEGDTYNSNITITVLPAPVITYSNVVTFQGLNNTINPSFNFDFDPEEENPVFEIDPALPDGFTLDPNTGVITGSSEVAMESTEYTVSNTVMFQHMTELLSSSFTLEIRVTPTSIYTPETRYEPGAAITITPTNSVSTAGATWTSWDKPEWLSINASNGQLTGTSPENDQTVYTFMITVSDIDEWPLSDVTVFISFSVVPDSAMTYAPIIIAADDNVRTGFIDPSTDIDTSDPMITFSVSPDFPTGLSLNTATGRVSYNFSTVQTMFLELSASYTITMHIPEEYDVENKTHSLSVTVVPVPVACTTLTISYNGLGNSLTRGELVNLTPVITSVGESNVTWTHALHPAKPGVTIHPSTGIISGYPAAATTANGTAQVVSTCGENVINTSIAYVVFEPLIYPRADVRIGRELTVVPLSNTDGYSNFQINNLLPTGLSLNSENGLITGTPTTWLGESLSIVYTVTCVKTEDNTLARAVITLRLVTNEDEDKEDEEEAGVDKDATVNSDNVLTYAGGGVAGAGLLGMAAVLTLL